MAFDQADLLDVTDRELVVKVIKGKLDDKKKDMATYVELSTYNSELSTFKVRTQLSRGTKPMWNQTFTFPYNEKDSSTMHLVILLRNANEDSLGAQLYPFAQLKPGIIRAKLFGGSSRGPRRSTSPLTKGKKTTDARSIEKTPPSSPEISRTHLTPSKGLGIVKLEISFK